MHQFIKNYKVIMFGSKILLSGAIAGLNVFTRSQATNGNFKNSKYLYNTSSIMEHIVTSVQCAEYLKCGWLSLHVYSLCEQNNVIID